MAKAYQYTADGYYAGEAESYGLLPNNATHSAPQVREGFIPRWTGGAWEQVENHKGKAGYLHGEPHTIANFGPLPEGFSDTPPLHIPELPEVHAATVQAINTAFEAAIAPLMAGEPPSATATYSEQRAEAEAYSTDNTAPTIMLDCLAHSRRIDKDILVQRVLTKSALYKQASGLLLGQQQALMDDVSAIMDDTRLTDEDKIIALEHLDITICLPRTQEEM